MKNIFLILIIVSFLTSCKKEKTTFSFEEIQGSSRYETIFLPCIMDSLKGKSYDNFIENGTFVFDYIKNVPIVYIGNKCCYHDISKYIKDIIKGSEYENKFSDSYFIENLRKDACNGNVEAWLLLHKIAIDSGFEAMSKTGVKVIAYDPYYGIVCVEKINGDKGVGGIEVMYEENKFIFSLTEYYLQSVSYGNWSLLNIKHDRNAREFCKKEFDENVKKYFPDYFKEHTEIKEYEVLKKSDLI